MEIQLSSDAKVNLDVHLYITSKEAAAMLGVTLRTVQLWTNSGLLQCWKTDGGHRRISRDSVNQLLQTRSLQPEVIAKPANEAMRILVVEDDLNLLRLYRMQLAKWTLEPEISFATNGYQGLVILGSIRPHLLITDLKMPNLSGVQMLRVLRSMPELDNTEIVVVTGIDAQELALHGDMPDGILVLPKPVPFARLEQIALRIAGEHGCRMPRNQKQAG